MHPGLINFNFVFDEDLLFREANELTEYTTFIDPKTNYPVDGWLIKHVTSGYGLEISNFLKEYFSLVDCKPRFYIQEKGVTIPFHKDRGTQCSFNFLLSENLDPISFRDATVFYKKALLDTSIDHAVLNTTHKRVLFKLSIFDKKFEDIKNVLPSKLEFK